MDKFKQRPLNCRSMQAAGAPSFKLLLRTAQAESLRSHAHATSRRDLYKMALLWISKDSASATERRPRNQSQTNSRNYAKTRARWKSAWAQYIKGSPRASQISLPFAWNRDSQPPGSMELGHNIHSVEKWLCLSRCCYRLVQSTGAFTPSLKQSRDGLLLGSVRGSNCHLWTTRHFQYRPGSTVHVGRICECGAQQGYSIQYGWPRTSSRQYFCRTPLEISKI